MANSWTERLKSVSLTGLMRCMIQGIPAGDVFDTYMERVPPGFFFRKNDKQALAYDNAALYQMCYMAGSCDAYADYLAKDVKKVSASFLAGALNVRMSDAVGKEYKYSIPLLFASSSRVINKKSNSETRPMVNGLFAGRALVVATQDSDTETKKTLLHETVHLLVGAMPELKDEMYGDSVAAQTEEIVTHLVTDKFEILGGIMNLNFKQKATSWKTRADHISVVTHEIEDISDKSGKSLITATKNVDAQALSKEIYDYSKSRRTYYQL